jgi:hypothetical protein
MIAREDHDDAVFDPRGSSGWSKGCQVHHPCTTHPQRLPICPPGMASSSWQALGTSAKMLSEQFTRVSVRGPLRIGKVRHTLVGCDPDVCCNALGGPAVVGSTFDGFAIPGFFCAGDESRLCCNAPVYGQAVIATGRIVEIPMPEGGGWALKDATLCEDRERAGP